MQQLKKWWQHIPSAIRKPIVLVVGILFIIASVALGWLPGPGGIPLFLVGIAILATEFEWAERIRDGVLKWVHRAGKFIREHPYIGWPIIAVAAIASLSLGYYLLFIK